MDEDEDTSAGGAVWAEQGCGSWPPQFAVKRANIQPEQPHSVHFASRTLPAPPRQLFGHDAEGGKEEE